MAFGNVQMTRRLRAEAFDLFFASDYRRKLTASATTFSRLTLAALIVIVYTTMRPSLATPKPSSPEGISTVRTSQTVLTSSTNNAAANTVHLATRGNPSRAAVASVSGAHNGLPSASDQRILDEILGMRAELTNKPSSWLTAMISSLLGGLLVAGTSAWAAKKRERFDDLKAQRELALQALEQLLAWRLKQAEQFYGPLHALLGQSKGVYEQLRDHLAKQDKKKYRRKAGSFEVRDGKKWVRFRLLDEMPIIYDTKTSAGPLIDEVMRVGERIVSTIHSHAGLALTKNADLVPVLAKYLAHFVVLNEMYKAVKEAKEAAVPAPQLRGRYTSGYYPIELGDLIKHDLMSITDDLRSWELALTSLATKSNVSTRAAVDG